MYPLDHRERSGSKEVIRASKLHASSVAIRVGTHLHDVLTSTPGSVVSDAQWYCMRGLRPMSPSTTTATWVVVGGAAAIVESGVVSDVAVVGLSR